jgi:Cu-processing system permease protein
MIEIQNLTKRYGRRAALDDVSLTLRPGEVTLLLGANGAGKSTLLRCLLGITGYEGRISVGGCDPLRDGTAVRSMIGYMPQTGGLHVDLTVADTMRLYAGIRQAPLERGAALLREAGLGDHAGTHVGELSGGMRQRLGFALALLADPPILVLDEPSASLDAASRQWLAARLREAASEGRTVIVSTHAGQELLEIGNQRVMLEDGRLISASEGRLKPAATGTPAGLLKPAATGSGNARPLVVKELRDALSNRWLIGYAVLLGALGLAATATGLDSTSGLAMQAFGRTTATLMNLCLLLAPLVAVLMGAGAIAGEQERGTLDHLLAQPLTRSRLLLAKHGGLSIALTAATIAGFVPAGIVIAGAAGPGMLGHYLLFPAIAVLAGAAMVSVGLLISVTSRSAAQAQGTAVFTWFAFVLLYDLVLMGSLAVSGMPAEWLAAALVANPVDAARVLGVLALEPDLYLLGPAGSYLTGRLGQTGAAAVLLASLLGWSTLPTVGAMFTFTTPLRRIRSHADQNNCAVAVGRRADTGHRVRRERIAGLRG